MYYTYFKIMKEERQHSKERIKVIELSKKGSNTSRNRINCGGYSQIVWKQLQGNTPL